MDLVALARDMKSPFNIARNASHTFAVIQARTPKDACGSMISIAASKQ